MKEIDFSKVRNLDSFEYHPKFIFYDVENSVRKEWLMFIGATLQRVVIKNYSKRIYIRNDEEIQAFKNWWKR